MADIDLNPRDEVRPQQQLIETESEPYDDYTTRGGPDPVGMTIILTPVVILVFWVPIYFIFFA